MKVLFFLDELIIGGTLVNAIELAATLRNHHGCEVAIFAAPGPMIRLAEEKGVRYIEAPFPGRHPSPTRVRALHDVVQRECPDVVNAWEPMTCFDAYALNVLTRVPIVFTIMMMNITKHLPTWPTITFGTPELTDQARGMGYRNVRLVLPPVDVHFNAPGSVDPTDFIQRHRITASDITLVTVSRLVHNLKGDSLIRTIDAVHQLGHVMPIRFLIVGDGAARAELEQRAARVNEDLGRDAIVFVGALLDPRPAYAAADIVVGMGGSALRAMAFRKPTIVVGENGFSKPFTPKTQEDIYYRGLYGIGNGDPGNTQLVENIRAFAELRHRATWLGEFSRQFVVRHFSLETISANLLAACRDAANERQPSHARVLDGIRTTALYMRYRRFRWRYQPTAPVSVVDANK
jgi:glycosyltransferase involved in cell wall biosynthesis